MSDDQSIALIGMSCKLPGANNPEVFWDNIISKKESVSFFDNAELIAAGIDLRTIKNQDYVAARGIITDVDKFDASFFGYSPYEASITDPQHRIFLEQAWTALESAGYDPEQFPGPIGFFAGMTDSTYLKNNLLRNNEFISSYENTHAMLATSTHYLSTKVAYALGLTGPCINVNTACSTSLVAIAMACESLNNYDCDMCLAGGITIIVPEKSGYLYQEGGILSPDGHCHVFDQLSKGTILSNGCGIVVLKRLADAIKDKDNIVAVLKGWAINNDGSDKVGFTAPSVNGQAACVSQALAFAGIEPTELGYMEAHGTGTRLGDPIEIEALTKGYEYAKHNIAQHCAIGSVKANIGHTDVAAGVAGLIKTALALQKKILPPNINYTEPNKNLNFVKSPFYVSDVTQPWPEKSHKRTAGVNSLGFGGTNAHIIMQEAPLIATTPAKSGNVLVLTAKTLTALETATENLHKHIEKIPCDGDINENLADIAYTLQIGRRHFKWRRIIPYTNSNQILSDLKDLKTLKANTKEISATASSRIIFGFPGQGTQYANMAVDLYSQQPFFKKIIDECCDELKNILDMDLRNLLFPQATDIEYANTQLSSTQYAQPALFVVEYALSRFLMELGIKPDAMIGHSLGEYVAATLSGVINLKDTLKIVAIRARLMAKTQSGEMLAVPLSKEKIIPFLGPDISLAAHNAPEICVVSGSQEKIADLEERLQPLLNPDNLSCIKLHTSHAFHSSAMDNILEEFTQILGKFPMQTPKIPFISCVTGNYITNEDLQSKDYWARHIRYTVLFAEGVDALKLLANDIFIEIGPGLTLINLIRQHQKNSENSSFVDMLPHAKNKQINSQFSFLNAIGKLWLHDLKIRWENLYINETRKRTSLPTYPFEGQSHWIYPSNQEEIIAAEIDKKNLLYAPTWERDIKLTTLSNQYSPDCQTCWLIFSNNSVLCNDLINIITSDGQKIYIVYQGNDFFSMNDHSFSVNPANKDHYLKLLQAIDIPTNKLTVIHAWSLNNIFDNNINCLEQGAFSLLYLTQIFSEKYFDKKLQILVLADSVYSVLGNETITPEKATIIGSCKIIPLEQKNVLFKFIDIEHSNINAKMLCDSILWEVRHIAPNADQTEIAYRGIYRWLRTLKPCMDYIQSNQIQRLKEKGVYLITGGLGGIGLALAEYLAKHYHANLVLISRSSEKSDQDERQRDLLNTIKIHAASLVIHQSAVEDETRMLDIVQTTLEKFGQINGIIHAAGVASGGVSQLKTPEQYIEVLKPKLDGMQTLVKLFKDTPLDFIALMSSINSIVGVPGQIDYCSANIVLDAYANSNYFPLSAFCVAINWQAWREIGMAANSKTNIIKLDEYNSFSTDEAVSLFETILNGDINQVITSGIHPKKILVHNQSSEDNILGDNLLSESLAITEPSDNISLVLIKIWKNILGVKQIGIDDEFNALGGNSLLAIKMLATIYDQLKIKLSLSTLLEAKTVRNLSAVIQSNIEDKTSSGLVLLKQGAGKNPLFILHPIGGTVFCYLPFVQYLKNDRNIYGLQDPSIDQKKPLFDSIEEMATAYLNTIRKVQPSGPYSLCGASFGATLVMEITSQLLQQDETVNFVGLLDGWANFSTEQSDIVHVKDAILQHPENSHVLPKAIYDPILWEQLLEHRFNLMLNYIPKKNSTKVCLFKASEILPEYQEINVDDNHWSRYSTQPIDVICVPGNHYTMLQNPNSEVLGKYIQGYLDEICLPAPHFGKSFID